MNSAAILRFLAAVRRRLWLEAVLRQLRVSVWVASVCLVLLAVARLGSIAIPFGVALAVAFVAGLAAMLPLLFSRPALVDCALRADRHFDSHSLFVTALETGDLPDPDPAARTVLVRAARSAAGWRSRLQTLWTKPAGSTFVLAIIPAFFALLLFELPQPGGDSAISIEELSSPRAQPETRTDYLHGPDGLAELRDAIVQSTLAETRSANTEERFREHVIADAESAPPQVPTETIEEKPAGDIAPGIDTASNGAAQVPGDARRNEGKIEPPADEPASQFVNTVETAISRRGAQAAGRGNSGEAFLPRDGDTVVAQPVIAPVPAPMTSRWTMLTRAEIAYAKRYIDATGQSND